MQHSEPLTVRCSAARQPSRCSSAQPAAEPRTTHHPDAGRRVSRSFPSRGFPDGKGSARAALCVVRGSLLAAMRTRVQRRARRAPHHEGRGSSRRAEQPLAKSGPFKFRVPTEYRIHDNRRPLCRPSEKLAKVSCYQPGRIDNSPEIGAVDQIRQSGDRARHGLQKFRRHVLRFPDRELAVEAAALRAGPGGGAPRRPGREGVRSPPSSRRAGTGSSADWRRAPAGRSR